MYWLIMAKKRSGKKLKTWSCEEGCDVSKTPCRHLAGKLPQVDSGRLSEDTKRAYQSLQDDQGIYSYEDFAMAKESEHEFKCRRVEAALKSVGLEDFRIEILMDRYVSSMTLKEIATQYGYVSGAAVQYLIKDTLRILKSMDNEVAKKLLGDYE